MFNDWKENMKAHFFEDSVISLEGWMESHCTDPRLARAVSLFLQHRGTRKFASLPGLDRDLLELAHKQDAIGWDDFLEGKITKHFQIVQARYLPRCPTMLNASDWAKRFIDQLIHITHSQWIYRNISKHHATQGNLSAWIGFPSSGISTSSLESRRQTSHKRAASCSRWTSPA